MFEQLIANPYTTLTSAAGVEYHVPFNHEPHDYVRAGTHWAMNEPLSGLIKCEFDKLDKAGLPLFSLSCLVKPESAQELVYEYFRTQGSKYVFDFTPEGAIVSFTAYSVCRLSGEECFFESLPAYQALDEDGQDDIGDEHTCAGSIFDVASALWRRGEHESFTAAFNTRRATEPRRSFDLLDADQLTEIMDEVESEGANGFYYDVETASHTDENGVEWLAMISAHED